MNARVHLRPHRRGTDLGRLDPACEATRHGTASAYDGGCRCPHARDATRIYRKRLRAGRSALSLVDATGTRRRIQALWAIGHTSVVIAAEVDGLFSPTYVPSITRRKVVTVPTRDAIVEAYRRLAWTPGASDITRARAAVAGFPTPLQWGDDIDDPDAVPEVAGQPEPAEVLGAVDFVKVDLAVAGASFELNDAERAEVLRRWTTRGDSVVQAAARIGINRSTARALLENGVSPQQEKRRRVEAELLRVAGRDSNNAVAQRPGVQHKTVERARRRLMESGQLAAMASASTAKVA